jgi:hypothetical protein
VLLLKAEHEANFLRCGKELRPVCGHWRKRLGTRSAELRTVRVYFGRTQAGAGRDFALVGVRAVTAAAARLVSPTHRWWVPAEVKNMRGHTRAGHGQGLWRPARSRSGAWLKGEHVTHFYVISVRTGQ